MRATYYKSFLLFLLCSIGLCNAYADNNARLNNKSTVSIVATYTVCSYYRNGRYYCTPAQQIEVPAKQTATIELPPYRPEEAISVLIQSLSTATINQSVSGCYANHGSAGATLYATEDMIFCASGFKA